MVLNHLNLVVTIQSGGEVKWHKRGRRGKTHSYTHTHTHTHTRTHTHLLRIHSQN
jgi:hypothetical protein